MPLIMGIEVAIGILTEDASFSLPIDYWHTGEQQQASADGRAGLTHFRSFTMRVRRITH
jgi:hypothetical protein